MEYKRFDNVIVARLDRGEEILTQLSEICRAEQVNLANINALGAVDDVTVGVFAPAEKKYHPNCFQGDFEIVSLTGNVNTMNNEYYCHLHLAIGDMQGRVFGGHLTRAVVSVTCEMFIYVLDGRVDRRHDEEIDINLFKFD